MRFFALTICQIGFICCTVASASTPEGSTILPGPSICEPRTLPSTLAIAPDGSELLISDERLPRLVLVSLVRGKSNKILPMPGPTYGIAFAPSSSIAFVVSHGVRDNYVVAIDYRSNHILNKIGVGFGFPEDIAVSPDGNKAYITWAADEKRLSILDLRAHKIAKIISTPEGGQSGELIASDYAVFLAGYSGRIILIDPTDGSVLPSIPVKGGTVEHLAISSDGTTLAAAIQMEVDYRSLEPGRIMLFRLKNHLVVSNSQNVILNGRIFRPGTLGFSSNGNNLFFVAGFRNVLQNVAASIKQTVAIEPSILSVDLATYTVFKEVEVPESFRQLVVSSADDKLYGLVMRGSFPDLYSEIVVIGPDAKVVVTYRFPETGMTSSSCS